MSHPIDLFASIICPLCNHDPLTYSLGDVRNLLTKTAFAELETRMGFLFSEHFAVIARAPATVTNNGLGNCFNAAGGERVARKWDDQSVSRLGGHP